MRVEAGDGFVDATHRLPLHSNAVSAQKALPHVIADMGMGGCFHSFTRLRSSKWQIETWVLSEKEASK